MIPNARDAMETMIVVLSRFAANGDLAAVGTLSPIPAAALYLAQQTHAPELEPLVYGDYDLRVTEGLHEFFGIAQRGKVDLFFLSGVQIDAQGNLNLTVIGEYAQPKVRLPGGAGSTVMIVVAKRTIYFTTDHSTRLFVPRVDFANATASDRSIPWRRGALSHVVSPLGVMKYDQDRERLILEHTMPGITARQIQDNTGFDLDIGDRAIPPVPAVTSLELTALREKVVPKLRGIYPHFCDLIWGLP